jgi:hypothetical protein
MSERGFLGWISQEQLLTLHPTTFVLTVSSAPISLKDIRQDFTHFFCVIISCSWADVPQVSCELNLLNYEMLVSYGGKQERKNVLKR